jgi:predicted dehydrogenase
MQQVLQRIDDGKTTLREVPAPLCGPREVLIANEASLVSAGTEKMIVDLAKKSLLGKARERPDQVRRVLQKIRAEGLRDTLEQVRAKLADPMALGYSSAGVVLEVGREVRKFRPGDRVASNGAHAEIVAVPQNLVARVPDNVAFEDACYAVVGAIGLQGVRLANAGLGDRIAVIGLGLIGQITVMLLKAAGCAVIGTDLDADKCKLAQEFGAHAGDSEAFQSFCQELTDGNGADAVLITASTSSDGPLELAAKVARRKAKIVAVGAIGLNVPRREFYPKELELVVSCSYGPGRYDADYEQRGQDYPYAYVRWTEQRNIEALLEQIGAGTLNVKRLTTHKFPIAEAEKAYHLMNAATEPYLGIVLQYPPFGGDLAAARRVALASKAAPQTGEIGLGVVGAGNFASLVLLPALAKMPGLNPRVICTAGGVSATTRGERHGFATAATAPEAVWQDPSVNAVFVLTRHDLHAAQTLAALRAGKRVFVEKPLAITPAQLDEFERGLRELGDNAPLWMIGFNRRFSPAAKIAREFFAPVNAPLTVNYRFNAGPIPQEHWTQDPNIGGGRLIGEACHAIDLAAFLVNGLITRIHTESIAPGGAAGAAEDQAAMLARFDNGSLAAISYFAGGDKSYPKERIEIFGGGKLAVIDDFSTVTLVANGKQTTHNTKRDKGHHAELAEFIAAIRTGGPAPIAPAALLNVSRATLLAVESLKSGMPQEVIGI